MRPADKMIVGELVVHDIREQRRFGATDQDIVAWMLGYARACARSAEIVHKEGAVEIATELAGKAGGYAKAAKHANEKGVDATIKHIEALMRAEAAKWN